MPSFSSTLPTITSIDELVSFLQISEFELKRYCLRSNSFYQTFERQKKSGHGVRKISAPAAELKRVQRTIKQKIVDYVDVHPSCTGYRRGMSIVNNAREHVGQRFVLNIDIKDFFQSINTARIAGLFSSFGYNDNIAIFLAKLCSFNNALPQGAPSSPGIANLVCHKLDRRLNGLAESKALKYTRYCDDITISGGIKINPSFINLVETIVSEEGFSINPEKKRLLTRRSCQSVTGLTVNDKVNIPRRKRRVIRAVFHRAKDYTLSSQQFKDYIAGLTSFIHMVKTGHAVSLD